MIGINEMEKVFYTVIIAGIISQTIKIVLNMRKHKKRIELSDFVVTGGMPSTHCALVSSLFSILIISTGLGALTAIATVLFIIVVTDSLGVRRTAGEEGKVLNRIIKLEKLKMHLVRYVKGHEPIQVLAGIAIGVFTAIGIWFI